MNEAKTLTLDEMSQAISSTQQATQKILDLLLNGKTQAESDGWLNIDQFIEYLPEKPAKPTIYQWVKEKKVPYHKRGKHLYFLKTDIDAWLKSGRKKTIAEIKDADHSA
jgi:excisionase family DNA binding protein